VKLGLGVYSAEWIPSEGISHHQVYANDLEQARLAEQVGLDSIWYTEHHFLNWNPNVMGMCAAAAAVTSRIQLGPSVVLGPLHNPIKLAEECAMLDVLSNGRFTIGIGLGYRDVEYAGFNVRRALRAPMTEDLIQVLKLAWQGDPVTFHGRHWDFDRVDVYPKPLQPGGPAVWVAGYVEASVDRAARLGDGFIMDGGTDSKSFGLSGYNRDLLWRVEDMVNRYKAALARHGRRYEDQEFAMTLGGFVSERGADDAWDQVKEAYMLTRRTYGSWYGLPPEEYAGWYPSKMTREELEARRSEIWLGSPDELVERFQRLRGIVGERLHVMFRVKYPGIPHEQVSRAIRLLGQIRDRLKIPAEV
jgi:alkanesulfonate monooxygenase SsuD/methylene tetrahydromethanopterin reductase-like flavin-dependent oxidoreductase (luciferase family)